MTTRPTFVHAWRSGSSSAASARPEWERVQGELGDLLGEEGISRRRDAYAEHFLGFGKDVRIAEGCRFHHPDRIVLDDDVRINVGALMYGSGGVRIGRHARIGPRVFIHSANHEIDPNDERALFERGYEYESVEIGDNCLISANVSILSGARIANGIFVACGAVVIKGEYPDGSRVMGVPARAVMAELDAAPPGAPSIAIVTSRESSYHQAAELLIESLGLPQVRAVHEGAELPKSVRAAIAIGPPGWSPSFHADEVAAWMLHDAEASLTGSVEVELPDDSEKGVGRWIRLPSSRLQVVVPSADPSRSALENAAALSLYYASKRLRKRHSNLSTAERLETHIALGLLCTLGGKDIEGLAADWAGALPEGREQMTAAEHRFRAELGKARSAKLESYLADVIFDLAKMSDAVRSAAQKSAPGLTPVAVLGCPELPAAIALRESQDGWRAISASVAAAIPTCTKTSQLAALGAAAVFAGDNGIVDLVVTRLLGPDMFDSQRMCVRSAAGGDATSYSPIMATLLLIAMRRQRTAWSPQIVTSFQDQLIWRVFKGDQARWNAKSASANGSIIDQGRRLISRSLLDNWLACLRVPSLNGSPYELLEHNYESSLQVIESIWLSLFREIQHAAGQPLIRLRPWPHGCSAALSLRYDIDRNTAAAQVREIADLQRSDLNAACGSWYAIRDTPFGSRVAKVAAVHLQEVGVHAICSSEAVAGQGVTCHSGPISEYWRGQETIEGFERGGAAYAEMLATQLGMPRRAWIGEPATGRATAIPLLPLFFPLEGSTNDTSLAYFDRLRSRFQALIESGGHIIVGSHPDLHQAILHELIERGELANTWRQPIDIVVDRCMKIFGCGNISCVQSADGAIRLLSRHTLADLHIDIDAPGEEPRSVCMQLNAGVPRVVASA